MSKTHEIAFPLPSPEGSPGQRILRLRGDEQGPKEMALGVVYPLRDGVAVPPGADLIQMTPEDGHLRVKTIYAAQEKRKGGWKPMSVSREQFESNWDRVFGKKDDTPLLN